MKPVNPANRTEQKKPTTFKPGKSGNPSGRPKQPQEFKEFVKANVLPAFKVILAVMNDENAKDADRMKAAEIVIDRAYGKATQLIAGDKEHDEIEIIIRRFDENNN
jgi:hypothetical protein